MAYAVRTDLYEGTEPQDPQRDITPAELEFFLSKLDAAIAEG